MFVLLALLVQFSGNLYLSARGSAINYDRAAIWLIDIQNLTASIGGFTSVVMSITISIMNAEWHCRDEETPVAEESQTTITSTSRATSSQSILVESQRSDDETRSGMHGMSPNISAMTSRPPKSRIRKLSNLASGLQTDIGCSFCSHFIKQVCARFYIPRVGQLSAANYSKQLVHRMPHKDEASLWAQPPYSPWFIRFAQTHGAQFRSFVMALSLYVLPLSIVGLAYLCHLAGYSRLLGLRISSSRNAVARITCFLSVLLYLCVIPFFLFFEIDMYICDFRFFKAQERCLALDGLVNGVNWDCVFPSGVDSEMERRLWLRRLFWKDPLSDRLYII
jgi:hypothetical protein